MTSKWIQSSITIVAAYTFLVGVALGPANASVELQDTHAESHDINGMFYSSSSITNMIDGSDFAITPKEWWKLYGFDSSSTVVLPDNGEPGSVVIGQGENFGDVFLFPFYEYPDDLGDGTVFYWPNWEEWLNWEKGIDPGDPNVDTVPVPGAIVLMGSAIAVLLGFRRVRRGGRGQKTV